jgi:ferredoxin--NADP+ reductase
MHNDRLGAPLDTSEEAIISLLEQRNIPFTTWDGWYRLDEHERSLGAAEGRERIKVVEREDMLAASEPDKAPKG